MGARRTARERALQALYQIEMGASPPESALQAAWDAEPEEGEASQEAHEFALELVLGVCRSLEEIDALIARHSHNWRVDRMSRIDRNVLRMAVFELEYRPEIPRRVTLNEAVELGKRFGSEASSAFINGLLDRIAIALKKD